MDKVLFDFKAVDTTPAQTRCYETGVCMGINSLGLPCHKDGFNMGTTLANELPYDFFSSHISYKHLFFKKCMDKRCKTCKQALAIQINESSNNVFCKSFNVIYGIICDTCNLIYIGQTKNCFNIRINGHRSDIKKFQDNFKNDIELKHFQNHNFDNAKLVILDIITSCKDRLIAENMYIGKFGALYPYGLNSTLNNKSFKSYSNVYAVLNTFVYPKSKYRGTRSKNKYKIKRDINNYINRVNFKEVNFINILQLKKQLFSCKLKELKWFLKYSFNDFKFHNSQIKDILLDIIKYRLKISSTTDVLKDKKLDKEYFVLKFENKLFDLVNINNVIEKCKMLFPIKNMCNIQTTFSYGKTLKSIICNYNSHSMNLESIKAEECYCSLEKYSKFVDKDHKHIITGNLDIIENNKLKYFMEMGSKFRPCYYSKHYNVVSKFSKEVDFFIAKVSYKYNWPVEGFKLWKQQLIKLFNIEYLKKQKIKKFKTGFFKQDIKDSIKDLKSKFIITTVDKADNNFAIICKSFYKKLLLSEYLLNNTYLPISQTELIIKRNLLKIAKNGNVSINNFNFPYLFATVKFHKTPVKFRFVTCSTNCYNKVACKQFFFYLNKILNEILKDNNCKIIINNSKVLNFLKTVKDCKCIETFDFENLFTNIPHNNIKDICVYFYNNYNHLFSCNIKKWLNLVDLCVFNNILYNGISFVKQSKGIPMGTSYSSAFANLFLHFYENKYFLNSNIIIFRYIDDLLVYNCDNFSDIFKDIYPDVLNLKKTSNDNIINFLDLKIKIVDSTCQVGLYDKRKDFNFKVKSLANWDSNLSKKVFRNITVSQLTRINNICNNSEELNIASQSLRKTACENGYPLKFIDNIFNNFRSF